MLSNPNQSCDPGLAPTPLLHPSLPEATGPFLVKSTLKEDPKPHYHEWHHLHRGHAVVILRPEQFPPIPEDRLTGYLVGTSFGAPEILRHHLRFAGERVGPAEEGEGTGTTNTPWSGYFLLDGGCRL